MHKGKLAPRAKGEGSSGNVLLAAVLGFSCAIIFLWAVRSRPTAATPAHDSEHAALAAERETLIKQIHSWNAKAHNLVGRSLEAISLASHNAAVRAGGVGGAAGARMQAHASSQYR